MTIIKPSTAFKQSADWVSAEVRAYMKDQVSTHVDTVQDVRDSDFEQTRFLYVRSKAATYRLNLSSGAPDDGDTVLQDNVGRRYLKVPGSGEDASASGTTPVVDRAALKALDTSTKKAALIYGEGDRNGVFVFVSGDHSDEVAADDDEFTWIAPASDDTGASGAWVRTPGSFAAPIVAPALRTIDAKLWDRPDLRDWAGIDLAGNNDSQGVFQAAVNMTAAEGLILHVPAGDIVLDSRVVVPAAAKIHGTGQAWDRRQIRTTDKYTYFHLSSTDIGFELIGDSSAQQDNTQNSREMIGINTYRDQPEEGADWTPLAAQADIVVRGVHDVNLRDLFLANPTVGIRLIGDLDGFAGNGAGVGRVNINNIRGQPVQRGIQASQVYDCIYIDNVHFWPAGLHGENQRAWIRANGIPFEFGRVDNPMIGRIFSWGYRFGLYFVQQASVGKPGLPGGTIGVFHADIIGGDNCGEAVVFLDSAISNATFHINELYGGGATPTSESLIRIRGNNNVGWIGSFYGYTSEKGLLDMSSGAGTGNVLTIGQARGAALDQGSSGDAAFYVSTGNRLNLLSLPLGLSSTKYDGGGVISSPEWRAFTPTVSAGSGTITEVGTLDCKYKIEGSTLTFDLIIPITTNGTGAGAIYVSMPKAAKRTGLAGFGRGADAVMCQATINSSPARLDIVTYNNSYPAADGAVVRVSGQYEIA